ncbi:MAG: hypothetical protein IT370_02720 [Deltaproteobacteria bacterium]|nr:hypothetical protein [Deltaproteobacteria bacterium]
MREGGAAGPGGGARVVTLDARAALPGARAALLDARAALPGARAVLLGAVAAVLAGCPAKLPPQGAAPGPVRRAAALIWGCDIEGMGCGVVEATVARDGCYRFEQKGGDADTPGMRAHGCLPDAVTRRWFADADRALPGLASDPPRPQPRLPSTTSHAWLELERASDGRRFGSHELLANVLWRELSLDAAGGVLEVPAGAGWRALELRVTAAEAAARGEVRVQITADGRVRCRRAEFATGFVEVDQAWLTLPRVRELLARALAGVAPGTLVATATTQEGGGLYVEATATHGARRGSPPEPLRVVRAFSAAARGLPKVCDLTPP